MAKKKLTYMQKRQQAEQVNKKAIIWIGAVAGAVIIALSIMLALNY